MLAFLFLFFIYLREQTRRSCLPFFSISGSIFVGTRGDRACLYSYFSGLIFVLQRSCQIVTCWHNWLACMPFFNASGGMISPAIFLYRSAITVISAHEVACDEVYVSPIPRNRSRVVLLLNFGLDSLTFLVNDRSDKPSKSWHGLYIVGRTWKKFKSIYNKLCRVKLLLKKWYLQLSLFYTIAI